MARRRTQAEIDLKKVIKATNERIAKIARNWGTESEVYKRNVNKVMDKLLKVIPAEDLDLYTSFSSTTGAFKIKQNASVVEELARDRMAIAQINSAFEKVESEAEYRRKVMNAYKSEHPIIYKKRGVSDKELYKYAQIRETVKKYIDKYGHAALSPDDEDDPATKIYEKVKNRNLTYEELYKIIVMREKENLIKPNDWKTTTNQLLDDDYYDVENSTEVTKFLKNYIDSLNEEADNESGIPSVLRRH